MCGYSCKNTCMPQDARLGMTRMSWYALIDQGLLTRLKLCTAWSEIKSNFSKIYYWNFEIEVKLRFRIPLFRTVEFQPQWLFVTSVGLDK